MTKELCADFSAQLVSGREQTGSRAKETGANVSLPFLGGIGLGGSHETQVNTQTVTLSQDRLDALGDVVNACSAALLAPSSFTVELFWKRFATNVMGDGSFACSAAASPAPAPGPGPGPGPAPAAAVVAPAPRPLEVSNGKYPMVKVPAGTYTLGCTDEQTKCGRDETAHEVTLTRAFLVGVTEVTQGQWVRAMGTNPSGWSSCGENCPVESVGWYDAVAFANAMSKLERLPICYVPGETVNLSCTGYRLPTEAEWEVAARGGATTLYPGGSDPQALAWEGKTAGGRTHPVGSKAPNGFGLYDLAGNVWELTGDWYGPYPPSSVDPKGPATGTLATIRGGSYADAADDLRTSNRGSQGPQDHNRSTGLRLVRTVP